MDETCNIRRLAATNADLAVQVVQRFAGQIVSAEYMEGFLSDPSIYLIVAEMNGRPAGFLLAHALKRLKQESHKMFIYEIDVLERHRRKGVGSALISHILSIVREQKMMNAFVLTNHSNEAAVALYRKTGGKIVNSDDAMFVYENKSQRS